MFFMVRFISPVNLSHERVGERRDGMKYGITIFLLIFCAASASAAGPHLTVGQKEFRFGEIFAGEKVDHLFKLRNSGDAPLVVERVKSSCGCTAAFLSNHSLLPGEEAELQAVFDSRRFQGPVVKTIYVYSNDPLQRVIQLHLRGTVVPEIEIKPARVDLGSISPGESGEATVLLINRGRNDIVFSAVTATVPHLKGELATRDLAPGEKTELRIIARPDQDTARLSGYILLETSSESAPELRIAVIGTVNSSARAAVQNR